MRGITKWNVLAVVLLAAVVLCGPTLLAQATDAVKTVAGVPPTGPTETSEWGSSVVWAFLSASLLEWMKRNKTMTLVTEKTAWTIQRGIGILLAVGTGLGIHASFQTDTGVLTMTGLLWPSIWDAGRESLRQWVFQEITYRTAVKDYGKPGAVTT